MSEGKRPASFTRRLKSLVFLALGAGPALVQGQTLTVHANQRVASLQMTPAAYADWKTNDGFNVEATRKGVVRSLYASFQDAFDFIFLVLNEDERPANIAFSGQLITVSNQVSGLGIRLLNDAGAYGSAGRLKSVMALTRRDGIMYGPSLHELVHNWANFVIETSAFAPPPGRGLYPNFIPHWGITGGSTAGQLGGFRQDSLVMNVDGKPNRYSAPNFGQNANGGNSVPYNQMELYLMGLIPLSEVEPFDVFKDITAYDYSNPKITYFEASTRIRYDQARLQSELEPRSPSHLASPKDFRLLIVVLCDAPLTTAQWNLLDKQAEALGRPSSEGTYLYNFWEATGGRATLQVGQLNAALKGSSILTFPSQRRQPRAGALPVAVLGDHFFNLLGRRLPATPGLPAR